MLLLSPPQYAEIKNWFAAERPGPLVGMHVINTGNGALWVDRWPTPRAVLATTADNVSLVGAADAFHADELHSRVRGYIEASENFASQFALLFSDFKPWPRVIFELRQKLAATASPMVRKLTGADAHHLWALSYENSWISKTWGGPFGLAASGYAFGAFINERLTAVACTFYLGAHYEDIGVVTEREFRGRGLSTACAAALCENITARGHIPSWSTSTDNVASLRVAKKLGFTLQRHDLLYLVGIPLP